MTYLDDYKRRVLKKGKNRQERLLSESERRLEREFETNPSYNVVEINGEKEGVIVNTTNDYQIKLVNFKPSYEVDVGSVVLFKEEKYIVLEKDRNEIYKYARMKLCNNTFKVETGKERVLIGHDEYGRPVYEEVVAYKNIPVIVDSKYFSSNDNAQLPLPEGKLSILAQHQEMPNVFTNSVFHMYEKEYKVADINYVNVNDGMGFVEIIAERKVEKNESS